MTLRARYLKGSHAGFPVLLVLIAISASASAAQPTRSLRGVVTAADGKPVKGAVVKIKNRVTLQIHQDASSDVKTLSRFNSEKEPTIDLGLKNP